MSEETLLGEYVINALPVPYYIPDDLKPICRNCRFWVDVGVHGEDYGRCASANVKGLIDSPSGGIEYPIKGDFGCNQFQGKEE